MYILNCIQYTKHCDKTQMLKKCPSCKINCTKKSLFFSFASSNSSQFYFCFAILILAFLYLKLCGIFHFRFRFVFIKVYNFLFNKMHGLFVRKDKFVRNLDVKAFLQGNSILPCNCEGSEVNLMEKFISGLFQMYFT